MAVIDTFLKLLVAQQAERLVLVPDEVPILLRAEETILLSMPAVPADLVRRLSGEILGTGPSDALAERVPVEGNYRTADGEEFSYLVTAHGGDFRIEMEVLAPEEEAVKPVSPEPRASPPPPLHAASAPSVAFGEDGGRASRALRTGRHDLQPPPEVRTALEQALEAEASDVFLSSGKPLQMRIDGALHSLAEVRCSEAQILALMPNETLRPELEESGSTDFGVSWIMAGRPRRFRVNIFRHAQGLAAAIRPIRAHIPSLAELLLPGDLVELCSYQSGLVLVTGASGSGKSTTLAALVEHINQTRARHIITIEDPIEYEHRDVKALIHQREVGADLESFSSGLRAALRENPDVILLGEMRDLATISAALTAAETGHLVLSTLHTGSATAAVSRIVDVFPGHQQPHVRVQLAASLKAVLAQRLVPATGGGGRVPAIEKLIVTPAVANGIRDGHEHHMRSAMQTGASEGMITLERSLAGLERRGRISRETAFRFATDPQALQKLLD